MEFISDTNAAMLVCIGLDPIGLPLGRNWLIPTTLILAYSLFELRRRKISNT